MAKDIILAAGFVASGLGATGLTVTVDVWRVAVADLSKSEIVTGGSATEIGDGLYCYRVAAADLQTYYYYAIFKTAGTADVKHLFGVQLDFADSPSIASLVWNAATRTLTAISDSSGITTLLTRLSAARAGYLDFLAGWTASIYAEIAALVWTYVTRTLTQSAASVAAAVEGSTITVYRGTTWTIALTGLGSLSGYSKILFTVKDDAEDADTDAILQVGKYSAGTDGLLRLNGAAYGTASDGSIAVDDASAGNITITVKPAATTQCAVRGGLHYDVKLITGAGVVALKTIGVGKFNIRADVTRTIS